MKTLIPLAEGFEEIEAISIIDILRRANIQVCTVHLSNNPVNGAHNIPVIADSCINDINSADYGCGILRGGMPGSKHLKESDIVIDMLKDINSRKGIIAAICAAPMALGRAGLLQGKNATCYPGCESDMTGAKTSKNPVVKDGNIITGKGPACAIPFALEIVAALKGENIKNSLKQALQVYWM